MTRFFITLSFALSFLATPVFAQNTAKVEGQFQAWLQNDLWPEAKRNGVWGRESAFGRASIPHNAFQVLATKAFMSKKIRLADGA